MQSYHSFSEDVRKLRYAFTPEETREEGYRRQAKFVASAENPTIAKEWEDKFFTMLNNEDVLAGGRIQYAAGRDKPQAMNCYALDVEDSRESLGRLFQDVMVISSSGGGIGINFSKLRPEGDPIKSIGGFASGPVSWAYVVDRIGEVIKSGGSRRAAFMGILSVSHPDIEKFINAKIKRDYLTNMNISVLVTNSFIAAVKEDLPWKLTFRGKIYKEIKARDLWNLIIQNAIVHAEPGILNEENLKLGNNSEYFAPFVSTNPCSEAVLANFSSCNLSSINLAHMFKTTASGTKIDWNKYKQTIHTAIRFLDNIIDINHYPLTECRQIMNKTRQIGLGVVGFHHLLIRLGVPYGNNAKCLEISEQLSRVLRDESYRASVELAKEKGSFEGFDAEKYLQNYNIKRLPAAIRKSILDNGIRNSSLNALAPTGTISIIAEASSSIEPIFAAMYDRRYYKNKTDIETSRVIDPVVKELILAGKDVSFIQSSYDLTFEDHLAVLSAWADYVDQSVSKTLNIPEDFDDSLTSELVLKYLPFLKGLTIYKNGSRENQPLTPVDLTPEIIEEIRKGSLEEVGMIEDECQSGVCSL